MNSEDIIEEPDASSSEVAPPFLVDSNAWIRAWGRYYPVGVFARLWEDVEHAVRVGTILIPRQIGMELAGAEEDHLGIWIKELEEHWVPHDDSVEKQMAAIIARYPGLVYKGRRTPRSTADAALIATAIISGGSVVSHEKYRASGERPSVTGVCDQYRVPWAPDLSSVFVRLGWLYS